jgi:HEAT repeat protein
MTDEEKINLLDSFEEVTKLNSEQFKLLKKLSFDRDSFVRSRCAAVLTNAVNDESIQLLFHLVKDKDSLVRIEACDSLRNNHTKNTLNLLIDIVKRDRNSMVRGYAISSISNIANNLKVQNQAIIFLEKHLKNEKSVFAKINLYTALYLLGKEEYLNFLIGKLNTRIYRNRCVVVHCLKEVLNASNLQLIKNVLNKRKIIEKTYAVNSTIDTVLKEIDNF